MKLRSALMIQLIFNATTAFAQTDCTFHTECFETESCTDTAFTVSFTVIPCPQLLGPRDIFMETDFGQLKGQEIIPTCQGRESIHKDGDFVLTGDSATYLFSINDDAARLTTHVEGPISITYIGECEVTE